VRPILTLLVRSGYHLVVTGHSLGAGVASLLHGRLTNKVTTSPYEACLPQPPPIPLTKNLNKQPFSDAGQLHRKEKEQEEEEDVVRLFADSTCIGFGTPPVVSESLAYHLSHTPQSLKDSNSLQPPNNKNMPSILSSSSSSSSSSSPSSSSSQQQAPISSIDMLRGIVLTVVNRDDVVCRASAENARLLVEDVIQGKGQWESSMKLDVQVIYTQIYIENALLF
jgi:hypothetical protein